MATKPNEKPDWSPDAGDRTTPTGSKKSTGFLADERPAYQHFNWFWYVVSLWTTFLAPAVRHNIIISDDADERDYATIQAYIADAPATGDRVLIINDQVIAAQIIIPSDITLTIQDGIKFTSAIDLANSLIEFGSNVIIEGDLILELTHTGTVDAGIELNGGGNNLNVIIDNTSTGTLTVGVLVNAAVQANFVSGQVGNSGAGTVTDVLNDISIDESNVIVIRDIVNDIIERSLGALSFLTGFTFDLGSDADGDIYYRTSGILTRLPKGADGQTLELASGIPSWQNKFTEDPVSIVKGWISFDGTGTIAINDSFNVSSIVDNGTGDYDINWDTDFANTDYSWVGSCRDDNDAASAFSITPGASAAKTVGVLQIQVILSLSSSLIDSPEINIHAFGDQ